MSKRTKTELPGYWVGMQILGAPELHVTATVVKDCSGEQLRKLVADTETTFKSMLPVTFMLGDTDMFGKDKDIPVYLVHTLLPVGAFAKIKGFNGRNYDAGEDGDGKVRELKLHVTVDNKEREAAVKRILENDSGVFVSTKVTVKKLGDSNSMEALVTI